MLGFFKKKKKKDPYLENVASILHQTIGATLPLENAYNLAKECLNELRNNISKGMFQDGPNPRENIMAYYSLCTMVNESSADDDKMSVLKISVMTQLLKEKLGKFENMSLLEKGIWQFGEQALSEGSGDYTKEDIEKIKFDAVQIIMDLMRDQEVTASQQEVSKIVENVSCNVGDREVSKVGKNILAVSVLSNATGYYIDQGKTDIAYSYFMCIASAISKYFDGQMESYNDFQSNALSMVMQDYRSLGEELKANSNQPFEDLLGQNKLELKEQSEPKINDQCVLYVNNTFPGLDGFTFEFEVEPGNVRTAMVSSDRETSDLFIRLAQFRVNIISVPGFEEPIPTKPSDIVEVKRQLGDTSVFAPGFYKVGDLDGDVARLTFFQASGPELPKVEDNPLNIPPEFAHDFFKTLRVLSEGKGLPLEQISADYYLIYQIIWPEFSRKIYSTETIHGYKLAKEYRTSPYQMVMDIADLAYLELGYNKSFRDLNEDELKLLYVLAGYKLARVIYDKAPDDHPIKQAD